MKLKFFTTACFAALLTLIPASAATLSVTGNATPDAAPGLYDYTYAFSVSGAGSVDNVFLGSDDLSPLTVAIKFDGAATADWSWLGNDTPSNYLQFFNTNGGSLSAGDTLDVSFTSSFAPGSNGFAVAENGGTGDATNQVTGLVGPMAAPEPASLGLFLLALGAGSGMLLRRKK